MTKKTSFVLSFLVFAVLSGSAYAVENYATEDYVDDQFAEVVGHVNKQDRSIRTEMKTNNDQLFANLVLLRDMLNGRDADKNWIKLETDAQLAIPAINELKAALDAKADADDVLTADALTELNDAIDALESGKASAVDLQNLQNTVDALGDTYATDDDVSAAIAGVQSAIDNIDLSAYAKTAELAKVATSGQYADLEGKPEIPSIAGLATETALNNLQTTLTELINKKQDAGQYVQAGELTAMQNAITALQTGKADLADVAAIQTTISKLNETYATDTELTAAIDAVKLLIPTIPTNVSAFNNDAGYITENALTPYAKSSDAEMVANKVATATPEQIKEMSSADKESKYPSIAVAQTIADAAVTQVNEVAGDLSTLQTQVNTNTADIAELGETVDEVEVIAMAAIPKPGKICQAASGSCALTVDTEGNLTWAVIAGALNGN